MFQKKRNLLHKVLALALVLVLLVPLLSACGGDDDETTTPAKPTQTSDQTPTPTKTASKGPIKIGVIIDFTGPGGLAGVLAKQGISFAEWYWNEKQGGILDGRKVEFVGYDNQGTIAGASSAARKAVLDGCTAVTLGGVTIQYAYPVADITDPEKVLFSTFLTDPPSLQGYNWTVCSFFNQPLRIEMTARMVGEKLNPETYGILSYDTETDRKLIADLKSDMAKFAPNAELVYEEYHALDAKDMAPYVTSLRRAEPDVLISLTNEASHKNVAKEVMNQGGWRGMQYVAMTEAGYFTGIENSDAADGWIVALCFLKEQPPTQAGVDFMNLWIEKNAVEPFANYATMYQPLLTAIKAIQMAGTDDPAKVAEAARSGKLEFDSPMGYLKIGTDGMPNIAGKFYQMQDGKPVEFYSLDDK